MANSMTALLKSMIDGVEKAGGKAEAVVCGSDSKAEQIREALTELGRDMHVIADDELSPNRCWVTSIEGLSQFPGGGRN